VTLNPFPVQPAVLFSLALPFLRPQLLLYPMGKSE
jgi:hypothetical protein